MWWIAGLSGARPMPPATISTSFPRASSTGHVVPNGPRIPTACPGFAFTSALVALPTERTVYTSRPVSCGSPLIEIGSSPTPYTYSMLNCPGEKAAPSDDSGSSVSVNVSCVSLTTLNTRAVIIRGGMGGAAISAITLIPVSTPSARRRPSVAAGWPAAAAPPR